MLKCFMTCATVFVNDIKWLSVLLLISSFWLSYFYLIWLPHMHAVRFMGCRMCQIECHFWQSSKLEVTDGNISESLWRKAPEFDLAHRMRIVA
jgi:hypothetical protein